MASSKRSRSSNPRRASAIQPREPHCVLVIFRRHAVLYRDGMPMMGIKDREQAREFATITGVETRDQSDLEV